MHAESFDLMCKLDLKMQHLCRNVCSSEHFSLEILSNLWIIQANTLWKEMLHFFSVIFQCMTNETSFIL